MSELSARFDMPLGAQAPRMARRAVAAVLVAAGWGVEDHEGGKRVWVQLVQCPGWTSAL
jgi:hypothetical protein